MYIEPAYQLVDNILKLKKKNFLQKEYKVPFNPPPNEKTYKKLICITGFGHSGSGTLVDYFSEFNNATVYGHYDCGCSGMIDSKNPSVGEIDFLRYSGGLFDIEDCINTSGYFNQNFILKVFIHSLQYYYLKGGIYNDKFWELTQEFINNITDFKIPAKNSFEGLYYLGIKKTNHKEYKNLSSPLLYNNKNDYIYYLKQMSIDEYRKYAKQFVTSFLKTIESEEFLVLDQILTTAMPDIDKKLDYLGDFKLICVLRDPRDMYLTGIKNDINWMPKNPKDFVKWFLRRGVKNYLNEKHPNMLCLRFEDIVLDYDGQMQKLNEFIGIDEKNHTKIKKYFNPEISKQNIGLYKTYKNQKDIEYIKEELKDFIF